MSIYFPKDSGPEAQDGRAQPGRSASSQAAATLRRQAELEALLAAGEKARAEETMRRAQSSCGHRFGPWAGIGASHRFCTVCGYMEQD